MPAARSGFGSDRNSIEMSSVIKISNQPLRLDLCNPIIGDAVAWCLMYQRNWNSSYAFHCFTDLESAKTKWIEMSSDTTKETPLFIQATPWHHPYVPKETFNSTWRFG